MSVSRHRVVRLSRTLLAAMLAVGLIHAVAASGDDDDRRTGAKVSAATPKTLFEGQLIVEGIHGFSTGEVARIKTATGAIPLVVTEGEAYVVRGTGAYNELPLATMVADARAYAQVAHVSTLVTALSKGAVLASSTARMFHLAVGQHVQVAHSKKLTITAIVDDGVISGYQMAVGRNLPIGLGSHADYVVVEPRGTLAVAESSFQRALPSRRLAFITPKQFPYFSPTGDVLSQSQLDEHFGVFYVRETSSGIGLDPRWISAYIWQPRIVQLGRVICNRELIAPLSAAMKEITRRGLGKTINTADFIYEGGCWNPRTVRFGHGMISHHAWGAAVDVNVARNPLGAVPHQDPRLVQIMATYGFTWGGRWLRHDGAHFEWVGVSQAAR